MMIRDVRKLGKAKFLFEELAGDGDLVVVNGGFFGSDSAGKPYPIGLVICERNLTSKRASWTSGGVLMQSGESISIAPIGSYRGGPSIASAIQSKPILVSDGRIAIWSDDHKTFNRTAIGLSEDGNIVVAGVFATDGKALSLYEFADFLSTSKSLGGPAVKVALALDGGPGAHLFFPSLSLHFGDLGDNYIPNTVHLRRRRPS